jgi:Fe-S oxidoreductase
MDMPRMDVFSRKPHPMENEYHSMCCGLSGVMYLIELVEGKDRPQQLLTKNIRSTVE